MNSYQPRNRLTGETGPRFPHMTLAALWVCYQPDSFGWAIEHVTTNHPTN